MSGVACLSRCVACGVVSQAPIRRRASVRAAAMTMCPGPGLLSHVIECGLAACSCRMDERTRGLGGPPVFTAAAAACWRRRPAAQQAGARRGSAACGRSRWWRSSSRGVSRCWSRRRRSPGTAWRSARLVHDPPQPRRALLGDVPVPDFEVRAAHRRGQPGPGGQLAGAAEPGDVADLGQHDQRGELPGTGQRPQHLDPRVGPGAGVQLTVDPAGQRRQAVDDRQGSQ